MKETVSKFITGIAALAAILFSVGLTTVFAAPETTELFETANASLNDPNTTYVIYGRDGKRTDCVSGNYLTVPENASNEAQPITIILDQVNVTQEHSNPKKSWLTIEKGNYVIVKLRGDNYIKAWSHDELGSNDGMSPIHVSKNSTVKITSEEGDGSSEGSLEAYGGGGKYGGAGIGTRYNEDTGSILIAGGTIRAYGGHSAAGIGSGRDGKATDIQITGGTVYAEGGEYAAGIGGGDNVSAGEGGDLLNLSITGGTITAQGGAHAAGIGCSEGGSLEGTLRIENAEIHATGGTEGAGIGGGDGASFWENGKILIKSGAITATGGSEGAGIGGGQGTSSVKIEIDQTEEKELQITAEGGSGAAAIGGGNSNCKSISMMLRGGSISAKGGYHAAAIGAGDDAGSIEIRGTGSIEAYGGENGAGIGAGNDGELTGHITIEGDTNGQYGSRGQAPDGSRALTITATASYGRVEEGDGYEYENEAAAIGSGKASCGDILVKNAVLHTKADNQGADIGGGGYHINPRGTIDNITIDNCEITSSSVHKVSPGIGAGYGGTVNHITITNTRYNGCGIGGAPMDINYTGLNSVKSIHIDNSDITAVWDQEHPGKFVGGITPTTSPEEHGAAGIGSGQYGAMDEITIRDSKIYAKGYGSGAGIGGGGVGGTGFLFLDLSKWYVGDTKTITITGSDVSAYSGKAHFDGHDPIVIYDGTVFIKIDNPEHFGGGAGIGGGSATNTGTIDIHDCGEIYAEGDGCGIGTGEGTGKISKGAVDYIWLEKIKTLTAKGGDNCAGIGTGGSEGGLGHIIDPQNGSLKQIYIKDCEDLKAYGGFMAAGIGTGSCGPCYSHITPTEKGDWPLAILDSVVYAVGGESGAGIGSGFEQTVTNKGGENPRTLIKGKCQVIAHGGDESLFEAENGIHGGGAGIGGGGNGAGSYIQIEVDEDYSCAGKGTFDTPWPSKYFVKAKGNGGAAGIGSGGCSWQLRSPKFENADSDTILIKKGAVFAKGSDSPLCADPDHLDYGIIDIGDLFYLGAGAGIGGGSAGSIIRHVKINGGYVSARAGTPTNANDTADDIGAGGNYSDDKWYQGSDRKNGELLITDGTVLAPSVGRFTSSCTISGGSISAAITDAGSVYRTTAKLLDPQEKVDSLKTEKTYGAAHIYSDPDGYVYLYLNKKGSEANHAQYADIEVNTDTHRNKWHYTGYTDDHHTGVLKIEGQEVLFRDPGEIRRGSDFTLHLADEELSGAEWTFSAKGAAFVIPDEGKAVSPDAFVSMHADAQGTFTVSGTSPYAKDPERFWGSTASFTGTVVIPPPSVLVIAGETSKTYDGQPAEGPEVQTDSDGAISYLWYENDGTQRTSAPTDAGDYLVAAKTSKTALYESAVSDPVSYRIYPKPTLLKQSAVSNGETVTLTAEVFGLLSLPENAKVLFAFTDADGNPIVSFPADALIKEENGHYLAQLTGTVSAGEYNVRITADLNDGNYSAPAANERTYLRALQERTLSAPDITAVYGDDPIQLTAATNKPKDTDRYRFEVIQDSADELSQRTGFIAEPTIRITTDSSQSGNNTAQVAINHAGTAVVRITLEDPGAVYNTEETYIHVQVSQKDLRVSSYAYAKNDGPDAEADAVKYGSVNTLEFALRYDGLTNGDEPETFTHGFGTLAAIPLLASVPVSEDPYPVGIMRLASSDPESGIHPFYSRDYRIIYDQSHTVTVTKATLAVQASDAQTEYGADAPPFTWNIAEDQTAYDGPASWDTEQSIFVREPVITLNKEKTGGQDFPEIEPGTYPDSLVMSEEASPNYDVTYLPGTLVITEAEGLYSFEDRSDKTWTKGSQTGATLIVKRSVHDELTFRHFTTILVDGKEPGAQAYSVQQGSLIATFTPAYLETLSTGDHTIQVFFDDGNDPETTLTVLKKTNGDTPDKKDQKKKKEQKTPSHTSDGTPAETGDRNSALLWIVIGLAFLTLALTAVTIVLHKRNK